MGSPGETAAFDSVTNRCWAVWGVDDEHGTIDLKIGKLYDGPLPAALVEDGPIGTQTQAQRLRDLGERVARDGLDGRDAATALLLRQRPADGALPGETLRRHGETATDAAIRIVPALRDSYLPIQGPPGTGKTYTAAQQILELTSQGRTVGITAPSHAVIHNLIGEICKHAAGRGVALRIGQRADKDNPDLHPDADSMTYDKLVQALADHDVDVAAGTTWMWSREQFASSVDTLFVDEAGQMSLANVLAVAGAARNLVLVGDPQQLAQPSHATHPPGAGVSALEHILGDHTTMPATRAAPGQDLADAPAAVPVHLRGLLRRETDLHGRPRELRRSSAISRRRGRACGSSQCRMRGTRTPPRKRPASRPARPRPCRSPVAGPIRQAVYPRPADILVVTPYNAQIRAIQDALAETGCPDGVRVGTVDKFQGRQAPVAIYSMATSSADDAPRGMDSCTTPTG